MNCLALHMYIGIVVQVGYPHLCCGLSIAQLDCSYRPSIISIFIQHDELVLCSVQLTR